MRTARRLRCQPRGATATPVGQVVPRDSASDKQRHLGHADFSAELVRPSRLRRCAFAGRSRARGLAQGGRTPRLARSAASRQAGPAEVARRDGSRRAAGSFDSRTAERSSRPRCSLTKGMLSGFIAALRPDDGDAWDRADALRGDVAEAARASRAKSGGPIGALKPAWAIGLAPDRRISFGSSPVLRLEP